MASIEDICAHASQLESVGKGTEAEDIYRQILDHVPGHPLVSYLYSLRLLSRGDYAAAWPHFQRRIAAPFYQSKATTHLPAPFWTGEHATNATILIHVDQGLGDLIMCCRYLPKVAGRVGSVVLAVPEGTGAMFAHLDTPVQVVELGQPAPAYDLHLHAFSLPAIFETTLETIPPPRCVGADRGLVAQWRARMGDDRRPKVGLCWRGNPRHPRDADRSLALAALAPLLRVPGIRFVSLQAAPGREELAGLAADLAPQDWASPLDSAAALVSCLDLVITVDSALAHLAGAVGTPAWLPLPVAADWRWLEHGPHSPWYPHHRLFRQSERSQWAPCIAEMAHALDYWRDSRSPSET